MLLTIYLSRGSAVEVETLDSVQMLETEDSSNNTPDKGPWGESKGS